MAEPSVIPPCPKCGNQAHFIGVHVGDMVQKFTQDGEDRDYDSYDSEIGEYHRVLCRLCDTVIYDRDTDPGYLIAEIQRLGWLLWSAIGLKVAT